MQAAGDEPRTLRELFLQVTTANAQEIAFRYKRDGCWVDVTWSEQRAAVDRISKGLLALGVEKGDRVCILSSTRLEWVRCDTAIVNAGAVSVGIYHSNLAPECAYILEHSEAKVLFVENRVQLEKILSLRSELPELRHIVIYDDAGEAVADVSNWEAFLEQGSAVADARLEEIGRGIKPEDLASLVYTSGTTGVPKGAMITHANLLFASSAATAVLVSKPGFTTLLFLPLAHVFARMIVYMCQRGVLCIAFAEDLTKVPANLKEIRPDFLVSVPRIYEKIHEKAVTTAEDAGGLKCKVFHWAVGVGRRISRKRLAHEPIPLGLALSHFLADRLVLHKIRDVFGGRVMWAVSGAAPLNRDINEFFHACGVPIVEGLGMTENTSLSNVNWLDHNKLGTVGPAVPGVEMKLAEDGEILFRGPNVMPGYFKNPQATAETIDSDGWLYSGDIGEIDADGFLTITDRKKDLIITAGGKNVAPQRIEKILRTSRYLSHVVACGDRRRFISALVTLDGENILAWAKDNKLESSSLEDLTGHQDVQALIETEIAERNRQLASYESVKQFRILPRDLSIEGGELTPSLKIKRHAVCEKYSDLLQDIYRK
jgi:long-chain acyl-CoA synthetase